VKGYEFPNNDNEGKRKSSKRLGRACTLRDPLVYRIFKEVV
jgi:hypothetical protein